MRLHREQAERKRSQKKEWNLAGTKLGNLLGVEKVDDTEAKDTDDHTDFRENSKFADHMKVSGSQGADFSFRGKITFT